MGGTIDPARLLSTQPCGCDPGAHHLCRRHDTVNVQTVQSTATAYCSPPDPNPRPPSTRPPLSPVRQFETGATRNTDAHKFDYEGFLNPEALYAFGEYMHEHRRQRDGSLRDSDNWQKGIPLRTYLKSLVRHTIDLWRLDRGYIVINPDTDAPCTKRELCCAIVFNAMGYLKELLDPAAVNTQPQEEV